MRYREIVSEATGYDISFANPSGDWRAWITDEGVVQVIWNDESHAEAAYTEFNREMTDDESDEFNGDAHDMAFHSAFRAGWLRVGMTGEGGEFIAHCEAGTVAKPALATLSTMLDRVYAESYTLEADGHHLITGTEPQMRNAVRKLMQHARSKET